MRTVLITGADRGLGYALARRFLEKEFVVFAGQYMPQWHALAELQRTWGEKLVILPLDSTDEDSIERAVADIRTRTGTLDIFVNNAGIIRLEEDILQKAPDRDMMLQFEVNALGALKVTEHVLPLMRDGMRRLCFVSSEAGSVGNAHRTDSFGYCMSKAALNMAIRLMHNELYEKGFTFRIYHPGWLKSYMSGDEKMKGKLEPEESAVVAVEQFLGDKSCENILEMQDVDGYLWSF